MYNMEINRGIDMLVTTRDLFLVSYGRVPILKPKFLI